MSRPSQFPDNYADDPTVAHILEQLRSDDPSPILVTGEAGTGKSTLVNYIRHYGGIDNTAILAPTGVAALNVGGQTIHSFFRFPFKIKLCAATESLPDCFLYCMTINTQNSFVAMRIYLPTRVAERDKVRKQSI